MTAEATNPADRAVWELTEALRLTAEYTQLPALPALPGWSWFDAHYGENPGPHKVTVTRS